MCFLYKIDPAAKPVHSINSSVLGRNLRGKWLLMKWEKEIHPFANKQTDFSRYVEAKNTPTSTPPPAGRYLFILDSEVNYY
jgi:hypothetical protein